MHNSLRLLRTYLATALAAALLAVVLCCCLPKTYAARVKVSNEKNQTGLLIGMTGMRASLDNLAEKGGLQYVDVYAQVLAADDFLREVGGVVLPSGITYYQHLARGKALQEAEVIDRMREHIRFQVSSEFSTLLLRVTDRDPLVAAHMADSVSARLQAAVCRLRTAQLRAQLEHALQTQQQAREAYQRTARLCADYADSHLETADPREEEELNRLQGDKNRAMVFYTTAAVEVTRLRALIGRNASPFAVIYGASVPRHAERPSLPLYILAFIFIAWVGLTWVILYRRKFRNQPRHDD